MLAAGAQCHASAASTLRSADDLRRTTAPALLLERARAQPDARRLPRQEARHLSRADVGAIRASWWRAPPRRLAAQGLQAGRAHRHHGGCLRGVADLRSGRAVARRHRLRHLSDRLGRGGRVPDARRRRGAVRRRGPGVRRPILPLAERLPALRRIVVVDDTALFAFAHDKLIALRQAREAGRDADLAWLEAQVAQAAARAAGLHRLHLRHHRPPQGRAGHARQAPGRHALGRRAVSDADARSSTARSPTCRCAMCSAATSPSPCRC